MGQWIKKRFFVLAAIVMLFTAAGTDGFSYGFYQLLRFLVCGIAAYLAFIQLDNESKTWAWTMGIMALIFNPIIPFRFDKYSWHNIDGMAAIILVVFLIQQDLVRKFSRRKK